MRVECTHGVGGRQRAAFDSPEFFLASSARNVSIISFYASLRDKCLFFNISNDGETN